MGLSGVVELAMLLGAPAEAGGEEYSGGEGWSAVEWWWEWWWVMGVIG
jgi:hypothetical protein